MSSARHSTMRALLFDGSLRCAEVPIPRPESSEALLRVRMAGICGTDLEITRGYKGFTGILGHEFVGEVLCSQDFLRAGQRVCGEINVGCRECPTCSAGLPGHCPHRTVLGILNRDGAFAEYLALPMANLHPIPESVRDEEAVFVEPLAAALEVVEQVRLGSRDRVVVLGDGRLGLMCAQVAARSGAHTRLVGHHAEKLALAQRWGIETGFPSGELEEPADVVIEATGSVSGLKSAMEMVRPRGTLVLKSTTAGATTVDLSPLVVKEITVVGSRCGPFQRAIDALADSSIEVLPLITDRFPLEAGVEAMVRAGEAGVLKVLLDVS